MDQNLSAADKFLKPLVNQTANSRSNSKSKVTKTNSQLAELNAQDALI